MLDFQNRGSNIKLLKFHVKRDNSAYLKKYIFNISSFVNYETIIEFMTSQKSPKVVSDPDSKSQLAPNTKNANLN